MKSELRELARLYGIQTTYLDMTKERREADPEALLLVLRAMGTGLEGFEDVGAALQRRKDELRKRTVEPVMVAWDGRLGSRRFDFGYHVVEMKGSEVFVISAPAKAYFPGVLADGEKTGSRQSQSPPREEGRREAPGRSGTTKRFSASDHPALRAPLLTRRGFSSPTNTPTRKPINTPTLTPTNNSPALWGIFAPIYALHSKRNPNAGDITDFQNLMDWLYTLGGRVAATLPLLGAFLDEPFEPSPYSPATRLYWNEFYIDLERIPEFAGHDLLKPGRKTKYVDYRVVMAQKRRILEDLSRTFFSDGTPERLQAFGKFVRTNKGVDDYAQFRAVTDRQGIAWNSWPARLRDGNLRKSDYDENTKNYHLYSQWIIQEQLEALSRRAAARGQFLYLDLPLGINAAGYDIWRNRDFFVEGVAGGAPPDPVFTKGQNWGFPPMNPEAMRLNRYQYVIAFLRNHFRFAKLLRIDHIMGLHRLYWIPDELTGDKGVYVEYPAEELWAILSLESHRYQAGIVGENLGTVPPEVNTAMARHDIRQMYVVQYEIMGDPEDPQLRPPPKTSVASLNTHDMPPFRAFLDGTDIDDRLDLNFLDERAAKKERRQRAKMRRKLDSFGAATTFLAKSMANVVLVNLEDLWEETLPQNVPATSKERPNWRRRVRPSIEQIRKMAGIAEELSNVFAHRSRSLPF